MTATLDLFPNEAPTPDKQRVGKRYDIEKMRYASTQAWRAVHTMAAEFKPGLRESEACRIADAVLAELGVDRLWHPSQIRFGANTTKTFRQRSKDDPELGEDDIYFIDLGPVFAGHEGDVGATFTTGSDPEKAACAAASRTLFDTVRAAWKERGLSGPALYDFAAEQARLGGWKLNLGVRGHRVSDFPHAIYRGGALGAFGGEPIAGVWALEIQIAHPSKPFGAFFEDLLM